MQMFKPREDKDDVTKVNTEPPKSLVTACKQIVDCLVRHILVLEEDGQGSQPADEPRTTTQRILACHKTLYVFVCKNPSPALGGPRNYTPALLSVEMPDPSRLNYDWCGGTNI
nr:uncharacterized protein LOC128705778 [Cherax quadricarinatus]